jgi:FkbM family methyltransferase
MKEALDYIRTLFVLKNLPASIRLGDRVENFHPIREAALFPRRLNRLIQHLGIPSPSGAFEFSPTKQIVEFDGRNAQFVAIHGEAYREGYELETSLLLLKLAEIAPTFFDIGANWGYFSLLLAGHPRYNGHVHAFEPNPNTYRDLDKVVRQSKLTEKITTRQVGVGKEPGTLRVEESRGWHSGLSKLSSKGHGSEVEVVTVDSLMELNPGLIKIDVEGMEMDVLRGTERTLNELKPFLTFESFLDFERPQETIEPLRYLSERSYSLFIPTLHLQFSYGEMLLSYGDPATQLLKECSDWKLKLIPVDETSRFLFRPHLNILAAHSSRIASLEAKVEITRT